jgi:hypothetical protein
MNQSQDRIDHLTDLFSRLTDLFSRLSVGRQSSRAAAERGAAMLIQSRARKRMTRIQEWISRQREYLEHIYPHIGRLLGRWSLTPEESSTKWSTTNISLLSNVLKSAPETSRTLPGFLYRKVVIRGPNAQLVLDFQTATSWSLNPLFAASFRLNDYLYQPKNKHILLKLPLKTNVPKLYIGNTSALLNKSRMTSHGYSYGFPRESEVIVGPMNVVEVGRVTVPLGTVTGISHTGNSVKGLAAQEALPEVYGNAPYRRNHFHQSGVYNAPPSRTVSNGRSLQKNKTITVVELRKKS